MLLAIFIPRERAATRQAAMAREQARVTAAERETTVARMQLLEAQVEPHFLYNTLAHVVSLVDAEPALAKRMLHRLIELLRATAVAPGSDEHGGLADSTLLRAYLDLIALRMGPRLAWSIDVPTDLDGLHVPPDAAAAHRRECDQAWPRAQASTAGASTCRDARGRRHVADRDRHRPRRSRHA